MFSINKFNNFTASNTPRDPRPPHIKFRVGDIVYHKLNKYRGVIIGWDTQANAPEFWLSKVRGSKKERDDTGPNYAVLIDTRFRAVPQLGYVMEKNIERVEETSKIYHPLVNKYFERYNPVDATYIPRPYLRQVYPND
uniref:Hemimethylated DNA-binding domain-containing protein n=1 Tax=Panagrolaimus davidi TaxID=227884 RepID=A0A914QJM4_9BILA